MGPLTFLVCDEVLYDDVGHVVSVGVPVFVQPVYCAEDELVVGYRTVLTANSLRENNQDYYYDQVQALTIDVHDDTVRLEMNFLRGPPSGLTGRTFDVVWCLA